MAESSFVLNHSSALVFVNPTAGGGRARALVPRIRSVFESRDVSAEFLITEDANHLETAAHAGANDGKRLLLTVGGDGTFQSLVNAVSGFDAVVGVLPAGGGNDFASALGLPQNAVEAARAILDGEAVHVDLARARTADGRTRLYVGGGGVGIDAEAARHASTTFRRLPGRSRYIAALLRALRSYEPMGVRLEFPGSEERTLQAKVMIAAVLNTPTYGAGINLAPEAKILDGWLDTVIVEELNWREVLGVLPKLMSRGELQTSRVKRVKAQRIRLSTERPAKFHGDGEVLGPTPVEIEVVPRAIQVLAPRDQRKDTQLSTA